MKYTFNYDFKKPELTDNVNINDINDNFDSIDQILKETQDINTSLDDRLNVVEDDTYFPITNLVSNGDFSNGSTGWNIPSGYTVNVASNEMSILADSIGQVETSISVIANHKYYICAQMKATTNSVGISLGAAIQKAHSGSGNYERVSVMVTAAATNDTWLRLREQRPSGYNTFYVKYVITLDLTATFGSGDEPSATQMNNILSYYQNSWFADTVNLAKNTKLLPYTLKLLHRLDSDSYFPALNSIINSDFSDGTTGWQFPGFTGVVSGNAFIGTATQQHGGIYQTISSWESYKGHKVYYSAKISIPLGEVYFVLNNGLDQLYVPTPVPDTFCRISGIVDFPSNATAGFIKLQDSRASGWTQIGLTYSFVLDLTATFGAGNEPTTGQMDEILTYYTNSWFNGTVNISNNLKMLPYLLKNIRNVNTELSNIKQAIIALGGTI